MRNQILLDMLCEKAFSSVKERLGDDINKEQYYAYLSRTYSSALESYDLGDTPEADKLFVEDLVDSFTEEDKRRWQDINNGDMLLSMLNRDKALDRLELLARKAESDAYDRSEYGMYLHNMKAYKKRLEKLTQCMDDIKPYNMVLAKRLLLNAILDLNYAFGNSNLCSWGLNYLIKRA